MLEKRERFSRIILSAVFIFLALFSLALAQLNESLTITTYYPSPMGSYNEVRSRRMAIGTTYFDTSVHCWDDGIGGGGPCGPDDIDANASLVVEGRVGIGTLAPSQMLDISGAAAHLRIGNPTADQVDSGRLIFQEGGVDHFMFQYEGVANNLILSAPATGIGNVMVIRSDNGNVGLGINPTAKLHVNGSLGFISPGSNLSGAAQTIDCAANEYVCGIDCPGGCDNANMKIKCCRFN